MSGLAAPWPELLKRFERTVRLRRVFPEANEWAAASPYEKLPP